MFFKRTISTFNKKNLKTKFWKNSKMLFLDFSTLSKEISMTENIPEVARRLTSQWFYIWKLYHETILVRSW